MISSRVIEVVWPYRDSVILCLETAANVLMLSSGVVTETIFRVFSTKPIESAELTVEVIPSEVFNSKQTCLIDGIRCTSSFQTLLDLLEYADNVSIQTLCESLADYYYSNGESFNELRTKLDSVHIRGFEKWYQDAIDYYVED